MHTSDERRRFIRVNCPCKVLLHNPERVIGTQTENISAGGVRVILREPIKEQEIVGLEIFLTAEPVKCRGRVVWVIEYKSTFDTGIEFYEIGDQDRAFVAEFISRLVIKGGSDGK